MAERNDYRDSEPSGPSKHALAQRDDYRAALPTSSEPETSGRGPLGLHSDVAERSTRRSSAPPASQSLSHADHDDHLLVNFFSSSPPPVSDAGDDHYHVPMSVGSRRAMWASLAIFAVSLVSIGSYSIYQQFVMPAPVELGGPLSAELAVPTPLPVAESMRPSPSAASVPSGTALPAAAPLGNAPTAIEGALAEAVAAPVNPTPVEVQASPQAMPAVAPPPATPAQPTVAAEPAPNQLAPAASAPVRDGAPAATDTLPSYEELIGVAAAFARKGRNRQALEAYQRALDAQPTAAAALAGIAYVHLNAGDQGLAKMFAERAVESDPTNSQGWIVLGAARALLGERAAAREAYRKCATEAVGSYVLECQRLAR